MFFKNIYITGLLIALMAGISSAQLKVDLEAQSGYMDNLFRNYRSLPDRFNELSLGVKRDYVEDDQGLRIYYTGVADIFKEYKDLNRYVHKIGFAAYQNMDKHGSVARLGMYLTKRMDSETYRYYDNNNVSAFANFKYVARVDLFFYGGYRFQNRNYFNLSPFSFNEHLLYVKGSWFLPSRTTMMVRVDLQDKRYSDNSPSVNDWGLTLAQINSAPNQQLKVFVKLAQSIFLRTGINSSILVRRNFSTGTRYLINDDGYSISNEEIFNDPYSYEGEEWGLNLKQILPWRTEISLGYSLEWRRYVNRPVYDLDGNLVAPDLKRRDDSRLISLSFSKSFTVGKSHNPLNLNIYLGKVVNHSNDEYFDYNSNEFSIGLSHGF